MDPSGHRGYEAQQMSEDFIRSTTTEAILSRAIPSFEDLNDDSWDFGKTGFQFSYLLVAFMIEKYGLDSLNQFIRNPDDYYGIFHLSKEDLHEQWAKHLQHQLH